MNGTDASQESVTNEGFMQLDSEVIDPSTRRNLTATLLTQYNNTEIQLHDV